MTPHGLLVAALLAMAMVAAPAGAQERSTTSPAEAWAFDPGPATAPAGNVLDLRRLNEDVAGGKGFIGRSADGAGFVLGDGTPVRFWATNTNVTRMTDEQLDQHARWLARLGVNMVRISGSTIIPKHANSAITDVDEASIKNHWRAVDALRGQGIYITIHHYWGKGSGADVTRWGLAGYTGKTEIWGLLFFNKELQRGYRAWLKELYARPNPSTGVPLAKDPAVGLIILQNEDSLLFWTSAKMAPQQKAVLGAQFADWAKGQYGSLDAALKAWDGDKLETDKPGEGVLGLYDIYHATVPQAGGKARRISDQYRFFVETMRRFNAETARYLREELGCRQLICAENWRTANDAMMLDGERYAYTANDVIAKNHYFSGVHEGPARTHAVRAGDLIADRSVLLTPRSLPVNMKHVAGFPSVITESTWTNPNAYQSEAAFLAATYGSMSGLGGFYWFATGRSPGYDVLPMGKFPVGQPMIAGMFPAAALVYRNGYVKPAEVVVREHRTLDDLWQRKLPLICEDEAFDPLRDPSRGGGQASAMTGDPLAFLVGRVEVSIGGEAGKPVVADLSKYIDAKGKTIRSITGELKWDYGKGVCTVDAPRAQGACGFLGRVGRIALSDVVIDSGDPYATVLVAPLDDRPIRQSRSVLVQIGTTARPTGWKTEPATIRPKGSKQDIAGEKIVDVGRGPWLIAPARLSVRIANAGLRRATLLDAAGQARRDVAVEPDGDGIKITAPPDTLYLLLRGGE